VGSPSARSPVCPPRLPAIRRALVFALSRQRARARSGLVPPRSQAVAKAPLPASATRFRIGALLCFRDAAGRLLLIERARQPNQGLWCAVGGKLEMPTGESPYECAVREAREEVGARLSAADLRL